MGSGSIKTDELEFEPKDGPKKVRRQRYAKRFLTQYVNDHGIWQEENIWKSVLQKVLN